MLSLGEIYVAVSVAITTGRRERDWSTAKFMVDLTRDENKTCGLCINAVVPLAPATDLIWFPFSPEVVGAVIRFLGESLCAD